MWIETRREKLAGAPAPGTESPAAPAKPFIGWLVWTRSWRNPPYAIANGQTSKISVRATQARLESVLLSSGMESLAENETMTSLSS